MKTEFMKFQLSSEAQKAWLELKAGKTCVPEPAVAQELGRLGLAYKPDRRSRSRRIVLTYAGHAQSL